MRNFPRTCDGFSSSWNRMEFSEARNILLHDIYWLELSSIKVFWDPES